MAEWVMKKLKDIANFNPRESLAKGVVAKKVAMDKLQPFCRDIPGYELEPFSGGTKFRNGDTIMARITPCLENGKTAKVAVLDDGEVGFGSTEYIVFRAKDGIDEDFIYYLVCSPLVREPAIKSMVGSSGRQRVQTDVVQNLEIMVPDYEEQKRISGILKSLDDKIAANTEVNKNLEAQAQALMLDYCDKVYDTAPLGTVMSFINGFAFRSSTYLSNGEYRIITIKNVQDGRVDAQGASFIDAVPTQMKPECNLQIGDVLLSLTGNVGRVGIVCEDNLLLNQRVAKFQPFDRRNLPFLYFYYRLPETKVRLETIAKGTAQANLSPVETLKLEFPFDQSLMSELSDSLSGMFSIIENNQIQNLALAETRDTLLPRLMSGELDVFNLDL